MLRSTYYTTVIVLAGLFLSGCRKLVEIPEPVNTLTNSETFSTEANATSAVIGIYNDIIYGWNQNLDYGNGLTTFFAGLSADELNYFDGTNATAIQFQDNTLMSTNSLIPFFWTPAYYDIYMASGAVENLGSSTTISSSVKNQLTGEAKFLRAYCYFYLVNLFGDIPLVTTTAWANTALLARTPTDKVYQQIIADLEDARTLLPDDYSVSGDERVRANKWAAAALLSRVYLYTGNWDSAESLATAVIGRNDLFSLNSSLNDVFKKNNPEAILQLQINDNYSPFSTREGNTFIPPDSTSYVNYYLTDQLLAAFEAGDLRRTSWVDSTDYQGTIYYYPYKYQVRIGTKKGVTEYYMLLRLAEQYLIRAEARAHNNELRNAIADLDTIRQRAGLGALPGNLDQPGVLAAVAQERRIELFAEWGHRWLDLKRTGAADSVLGSVKTQWQPSAKLYPIPLSELRVDPNLVQNPGY